jgi:hypothetical protein
MRKWVIFAVVAGAFVACAVGWVGRCVEGGDVLCYFEAGEAVLTGADPYAGSCLATAGYLCAPFLAVLMAPFAVVPRVVAAAAWFIFNFGSLLLLFSVSLYLLESPDAPLSTWLRGTWANLRAGRWNWVLVATAVLSARLWWDNLGSGQINVPLWAFGLLGVYFARRRKEVAGGAILGAAVLVKLMAAPLLLYLLIRRRYRALISAAVAAALLSAVTALFLGWGRTAELNRRWYQVVIKPAAVEDYVYAIERNESVAASLYAYNKIINRESPHRYVYVRRHFRWVKAAAVALFAAVIAFFVAKCGFLKRRPEAGAADNLLLALIILTGVLLQPLAWLQHFVVAVFAYMAVLYYAPRIGGPGVRYVCYVLLALSFAGHTLIAADVWGAAVEDVFFRLKIVTFAMVLLYAAVVVQLAALCRRRLPAAVNAGGNGQPDAAGEAWRR